MNIVVSNENSILSTVVAEMMGKEHKYLMRDIKRYSNQMDGAKISPSDFWQESTYINSQNKEQPCYLITKKGCEFIAHKLTGTKGTVFTARYINRFHQMEEELRQVRYNDVEPLPERLATKSLTPLYILHKNKWYYRNLDKLNALEQSSVMTKWRFYDDLRWKIQDKYNYSEAVATYVNETKSHSFSMRDLVDYFPEFQKEANAYMEELLKKPRVQEYYNKIIGSN